ncbi:MAG: L,D-transpeptidase [Verrucomicrobia bacterium]|nr:L,D-transpeptidase [Verrucomicrobiota bacterium]
MAPPRTYPGELADLRPDRALRLREGLAEVRRACRRAAAPPPRTLLVVCLPRQRLHRFVRTDFPGPGPGGRDYCWAGACLVSSSRFGVGQEEGSFRTPLGLHRVASVHGLGLPPGAVLKGRRLTGYVWQGCPQAPIAHRVLWLEGLEPGRNRGGACDSRRRLIYLHGLGEEPTLGRPHSRGCIHLAGKDLIPLADRAGPDTLVWITRAVWILGPQERREALF